MHEIAKYFLLTEIQEQCLNPVPATRSAPSRPTEDLVPLRSTQILSPLYRCRTHMALAFFVVPVALVRCLRFFF